MAHLCPICKSSLYHAAPAKENHDVFLEEVPEHLRGHQCCGTKCGHLLHKVCLCRALLGKLTSRCPLCSKELVIGEVNPLTLPPIPQKSSSEKSRWLRYPKPAGGSDLPPDFYNECSKYDKRPAFLVLNRTKSPTFHPTVGNHPPAPPNEPGTERPLLTHLMRLDEWVVGLLQNQIPQNLQYMASVLLLFTENLDEALETKTQMTAFVGKMSRLRLTKGFHSFQLLPGVVKWLLGLDIEVARNGAQTWIGRLQSFYDHLIKPDVEEGFADGYKMYSLVSLPELLAASQTIGAVDFFRLILMYNELNKDGLIDTMKSRFERVLFLLYSQPFTRFSFFFRKNAAEDEIKEGIANVTNLVALMESIVDWMMEQGFLE